MGLTKGKGQTLVTDDSKALLAFAATATTEQEASTSRRLEKSREAQKRHKAPKEASKLKDKARQDPKKDKLSPLVRCAVPLKTR